MEPNRDALMQLASQQLAIFDRHFAGDAAAEQTAFEDFAQGLNFNDRRPVGDKVHKMDTGGPDVPPRAYHVGHVSLVADDPAVRPLLAEVQATIEAVLARLAQGDLEGPARQFVEQVALGPGAWQQPPSHFARPWSGAPPPSPPSSKTPTGPTSTPPSSRSSSALCC
jgi:hypothetical protein